MNEPNAGQRQAARRGRAGVLMALGAVVLIVVAVLMIIGAVTV